MLKVIIITLDSHTLHLPPFNTGHIAPLLKILVCLSVSFGVKIGVCISHQNLYIFFALHSSPSFQPQWSPCCFPNTQVHALLRSSHSLFSGMFLLFLTWLASLDRCLFTGHIIREAFGTPCITYSTRVPLQLWFLDHSIRITWELVRKTDSQPFLSGTTLIIQKDIKATSHNTGSNPFRLVFIYLFNPFTIQTDGTIMRLLSETMVKKNLKKKN